MTRMRMLAPDWYVVQCLRAVADLAPLLDDHTLLRLWSAYANAAPPMDTPAPAKDEVAKP